MASSRTRRIRVVVADDAPDVRFVLKETLSLEDGFEVVGEAANGSDLLRLVDESRPDLILLDLAMPVLDGMAAIPEIRRRSPATVVVVLSGAYSLRRRPAMFEAGAHAFIEKGTPPSRIAERLRSVLASNTNHITHS
jgi:DNA-binding NarL/FixJ family response regulator